MFFATLADPVDKPAKEPAFTHPPLWIHESVAGKFFAPLAARREARRRAILELIERLPPRDGQSGRPRK